MVKNEVAAPWVSLAKNDLTVIHVKPWITPISNVPFTLD
jgi:hypothetical protein